jgi:hypothetical protein
MIHTSNKDCWPVHVVRGSKVQSLLSIVAHTWVLHIKSVEAGYSNGSGRTYSVEQSVGCSSFTRIDIAFLL